MFAPNGTTFTGSGVGAVALDRTPGRPVGCIQGDGCAVERTRGGSARVGGSLGQRADKRLRISRLNRLGIVELLADRRERRGDHR